MDDHRILRLASLALPAAVWVLGVVTPPPRTGLSPAYLLTFTGLLAGLVLVDRTAPPSSSPAWRRITWLLAELGLCFFVVIAHGTLVRPALIYLLPTSRSLMMFGERRGLFASLLVWVAYGLNVLVDGWPDKLIEYYPNYFSFFLAPYAAVVVYTTASVRQVSDQRRLQLLYDELRSAHQELQALHQHARETAVLEERNRLAREIHDSLAHYLTVIAVQLEAAQKLVETQPERARAEVVKARRFTVECLQEVRRSVAALRAASLDELSLPRALRKLAGDFESNTGISVRVDIDLPEELHPRPEAALALYRVAQEGLTNVHRHAHASRAALSLRVDNTRLELAVRDNGVGPSEGGASGASAQGGFGLIGLRERVELLGGQLVFDRSAPRGALLMATVPMVDEPR